VFVSAPIARQLDLHDGQVVQAVVETRHDQLKLVLQGQVIEAPVASFLKAGDSVQLKAQFSTSGQLILQMQPPLAQAAKAMISPQPQLPTRLNTLLHQPPSFGHWVRLMNPGVLASMIPASNAELLQNLRQMQLTMASLQPQALRAWVMKNSKSNESALAEGGVSFDADVKNVIRHLLAKKEDSDESDTSDSQSNLHHALDEIEASQLRAVQNLQQGNLDFTLVIPFRDAHPVEIQFERKGQKKGQPKNPMVVNMHTDSSVLGEVWLKTSITDGKQVDLTMWATREDVAQQAQSSASELTDELESAGLTMGSFQVFNAPRPAPQIEPDSLAHGALIDTKA
jgi:hypothetical protein